MINNAREYSAAEVLIVEASRRAIQDFRALYPMPTDRLLWTEYLSRQMEYVNAQLRAAGLSI